MKLKQESANNTYCLSCPELKATQDLGIQYLDHYNNLVYCLRHGKVEVKNQNFTWAWDDNGLGERSPSGCDEA